MPTPVETHTSAPRSGRAPRSTIGAGPGRAGTRAAGCGAAHDPTRLAAMRARLVSEATAEELAETFRVLGDPTRVRLIDALSAGELCVCDLAAAVGLSESAVSHQLRLLRAMRLVRARRAGRLVYYAIDDRHILDLFVQGRRHVQERS